MTEELLVGIFAGAVLLWVAGIVIVFGVNAWQVIADVRKNRKNGK